MGLLLFGGEAVRGGNEKGVALIMVLGLIAIISAWAVDAAYEDMVSLRKMENRMAATRARLACESAFELAGLYLHEDAKDNQVDHLDEEWAQPIPPLPIDQGMVSGSLRDANRYFNLNDLIDKQGKVDQKALLIAKRLFTAVEVNASLVDALVDWMDADSLPFGAGGAEDAVYYDRPYPVKNAPMDRWQELAMVAGFEAEVLEKLKPVTIVRNTPESGITPININTAPEEVLLALFPEMMAADAQSLAEMRPYENVSDAIGTMPWANGADASRLSIVSDAFIVRAEAAFDRVVWREEQLLIRNSNQITSMWRERIVGLDRE